MADLGAVGLGSAAGGASVAVAASPSALGSVGQGGGAGVGSALVSAAPAALGAVGLMSLAGFAGSPSVQASQDWGTVALGHGDGKARFWPMNQVAFVGFTDSLAGGLALGQAAAFGLVLTEGAVGGVVLSEETAGGVAAGAPGTVGSIVVSEG